jgi:hypothetical protein
MRFILKIKADYRFRQLIIGIGIGSILTGLFVSPKNTNLFLDSIQKIVVIIGTIFTAYWTSKTFTYSPKKEEATELFSKIDTVTNAITEYEIYADIRDAWKHDNDSKIKLTNKMWETSAKIVSEGQAITTWLSKSNYILKTHRITSQKIIDESINKIFLDFKDVEKGMFNKFRDLLIELEKEVRGRTFFTIEDEIIKILRFLGFK